METLTGLDRHITGNYGEDQYGIDPADQEFCPDCGSTNLSFTYCNDLTACLDCGWHEEE